MQTLNIYMNRFLGDFIPIIPFLGVLFLQHGLTLTEISLLFLLLAVTTFLLEIPTGIISDKFSSKHILLISRTLKLIAFAHIMFFPSLAGFSIGMILWGTASAFDSGAFQAYLYVYNREYRVKTDFNTLYARSATASFAGILTAAIFATQTTYFGMDGLQTIGLVALALALISALFLKQTAKSTASEKELSFIETLKQSNLHIRKSELLVSILLIGVIAGATKGTLDEYTSLMLDSKGLLLAYSGYALLVLEFAKIFGSVISERVRGVFFRQTNLLLLIGVCFVCISFANIAVTVLLLVIVMIVDSMLWIQNDVAIQEIAQDNNRATLASIKNFGTEIAAALFLTFIFAITFYVDISKIYFVTGFLILGFIIVLKLKSKQLP